MTAALVSTRRLAVVLGIMALLMVTARGGGRTDAAPLPAGGRIPWQGGSWYLHGANVPWYNWGCDFGCGIGTGDKEGVSDPEMYATLDAAFAQARAAGVRVLRWWVFPGEPQHILRDAGGPTGLNPVVELDMDAAVRLAEQHDLYYIFTLFSAPTHIPTSWLTDPAQRERLVAVLGKLFARYRDNPRILAWDFFNEPDWDIFNGRIDRQAVRDTVRALAEAVHTHSTAYATVAAAHLEGLPNWTGLGLDFYTANWYDYMQPGGWCALCTDYAEVNARFGLDAPLVIGEFYGGADVDPINRFAAWHRKGYAGALAWSLFWDHTADRMQIDLPAAGEFSRTFADIGPRRRE
jgi:hypothetical protein